ncbi:hypothetical protein SAY86_023507 [Trapa natans]|uniref:Uncharacterized protein n=1 Tax=Trapa natans TaxID=22666 RepID=A0AAN7M791_TRANT|nr:hypothetical protein SAY86_023507 [Trapa natans]
MLKRSATRNQRSRSVKVKHCIQIVVLLGICIWLIYQVKYSHNKKKELSGHEQVRRGVMKLGRKDLRFSMEDIGGNNEKQIGEEEEEEDGRGKKERTEVKEEVGKSKVEEIKEQEDEQGEEKGHEMDKEEKEHHLEEEDVKGDKIEDQDKLRDEIDREEDFIDEEKGREDYSSLNKETAEDNAAVEEEEKQVQVEDEHQNLKEDEAHDEVDRTTHEAREENYNGDDASSAVAHFHDELVSSEVQNLNLDFANESGIGNNRSGAEDGKKLEMADKELNLKDIRAENKDNMSSTGAAIVLQDSPPRTSAVSTENNGAKITIGEMNVEDLSMDPPNGTESAFHSPEAQNSTTDVVNDSNTTSDGVETKVLPTPNAAGSVEFSNSTGTDLASAVSDQRHSSDQSGCNPLFLSSSFHYPNARKPVDDIAESNGGENSRTAEFEEDKMSSIAQNILMAFTATVNKLASSNARAVPRGGCGDDRRTNPNRKSSTASDFSRRCLLLAAAVVAPSQAADSRTQLLKKYLKKSQENKDKNDKERLESYYKRNYKDYFEFVEGSLQGKSEQQLSESEKGILDWLKSNK